MASASSGTAYSRNIWKFSLIQACQGLRSGVSGPTLTLFFLDKSLSLAQFMILMGILNLSIFLFEIPTGIVADRVSRKLSMIIGLCLWACAELLMLLIDRFWILTLVFFAWGLGETFISGADTALLYDSLKADQREHEAQKVLGTTASILMVVTVVGSLCNGLVVALTGLRGTIIARAAILAPMILIATVLREPPMAAVPEGIDVGDSLAARMASYWQHFRESLRLISRNRQVFVLVAVQFVLLRIHSFVQRPYAQPYLLLRGFSVSQFGYFYAGFGVIGAILSKLSHRVSKLLGSREKWMFALILLLSMTALTLFVFAWSGVVVVAAMAGVYMVNGLSGPAVGASLNRRLPSEKRAACLSVSSAGNHLLGMSLGPVFGYIIDAHSLGTSLLVFFLTFGPLLIVGLVLVLRTFASPGSSGPTGDGYKHSAGA